MPRIDWSTGVPVVLREEQSTNLITYSEDASQWEYIEYGAGSAGILELNQLDPSGTNKALKVTFPADAENAALRFGEPYTSIEKKSSIYIKSLSGQVNVMLRQGAQDSKIITINSEEFTRFQTNPSVNEEVLQIKAGSAIEETSIYFTIVVSFPQVEPGTEATSYIPTNGTTETRLADNISVPTPAGVTSITETIDGVEETPITTIPATYSLPVGNINKVKMQ